MPYKNLFNDGYDDGTDNMFPEEWIASKVKAINPKYFGERDNLTSELLAKWAVENVICSLPN